MTVESATTDFDGARRFRVRYDTPTVAGFTFSGAWGREILRDNNDLDYYDVAARYQNEFGNFQFAAGVGYNWNSGDYSFGSISAGLLHTPSRIDVTFAAGADNNDANFIYGKLGISRSFFGNEDYLTSFGVDYYLGNDLVNNGSESRSYGIAIVQKLGQRFEVYGSYRVHEVESSLAEFRDANALFLGARYKFYKR